MDYKDKIRKLLALAKSPEPEEAKLALLKARKLMAEHKLSERDLEERNTTVIKRAIGEKFSKKANSWMASTKFEVSMEIFKFQGEPDVSVTLTGKSPTELETALKTLETIAKTTTLYDGNSAPEAEKNVPNEPQQAAPVVSSADKKAPPREAGKLAYARRRKGAHVHQYEEEPDAEV